jgi:hypothetical protein
MEEIIHHKPNPYEIPRIPYPVINNEGTRILTKAIAEAWEIPEEKVLGSTEVIDMKHPSPKSARGERMKVPGKINPVYANARKFYFYVMIVMNL